MAGGKKKKERKKVGTRNNLLGKNTRPELSTFSTVRALILSPLSEVRKEKERETS